MAQLDSTASGSFVSGVIIGQTELAQMTFTANDQLASSRTIGGAPADIISASQINGTGYVFGARDDGSGISAWTTQANGGLAIVDTITVEDGLWMSAPTALETAQEDGQTTLIPGSAGSHSLSVLAVGTDHLLDDRNSRFGGVSAIEVAQLGAHSYVIAGGADEGICTN